jgi:hypothetical protein
MSITDPTNRLEAARAAVAAAADSAYRAATRHAEHCCRLAALLVASVLPDAAVLVVERSDDTVTADTDIALIHIRDGAGTLLWYDPHTPFAAHPDARTLGAPTALDPVVLDEVRVQLCAAYDTAAGHFTSTADGADVLPWANLLALPVSAPPHDDPQRAGREVAIETPGRFGQSLSLTGDDAVLVPVAWEAVFAIDPHDPARWHRQVRHRIELAGQFVNRTVTIQGITTEARWRDLEATLGLDRDELSRSTRRRTDQARHLTGHHLDAAVNWARRQHLTYQDELRIQVPAGTRRVLDDAGRGRTVHLLEWNRGEHGTDVYLLASRHGAVALRDQLIRAHWAVAAGYPHVPSEPPADPAAALAFWDNADPEHADPYIGLFTIATAVVADVTGVYTNRRQVKP